jgi:RNA polymerase sigma-70 factor (ECF subfamily)
MTEAEAGVDRSDEALMALYADGDAGAFDELFRRHEARAYAYFLKRTRSPERARDLYQELFLRIHRSRDVYDAGRGFAPWFFQIAHHLLIDDQRRAHRCHEVPLEDRVLRADGFACDDRLADREELSRALAELSPEERYILVSSKLEGVGYRELALRLGKSVDAVKKAASRAMQRLRQSSGPRPAPAAAEAL